MHLQAIQRFAANYVNVIEDGPLRYVLPIIDHFHRTWQLEAEDFAAMFGTAIHSDMNRRLWSRTGYQPKEAIMLLSRIDQEQVRAMFSGLFQERQDLDSRISKFQLQADVLLADYQKKLVKPLLAGHDQSLATITFYLGLRMPEKYTPYDHDGFVRALQAFQVKNIPLVNDYDRWLKVTHTLRQILKNVAPLQTIWERMHTRLNGISADENKWIVWDFIRFVSYGDQREI